MTTDIIGALGAGSGVDVKSLAQSLVDVEKTPREGAINGKIDDQERRVAGYSALMLSLESVKTAFQKLNDLTDFNAGTVTTTPVGVVGAVTTASAVPGRHTIEVQQLAAPQRLASGSFTSATQSLNSGNPFSIGLTVNSVAKNSVHVATPTPEGIVKAINDSDQGITAQLLSTGDPSNPFKIVLAGAVGATGGFTMSSDDASGTARADTLTFQPATASGSIVVAGVSVSVTAGQTATEVAEAARAALAASVFITGVSGRSVATGASGGQLTLQWAASDGATPAFSATDASSTGATVASSAATAFVGGSSVTGVDLGATTLQAAQDAVLVVDGLRITRSSNAVDDAIPGVYLDLLSTNVGTTANIRVARDTTAIKENLQAVVDAYNLATSDFAILTGARSDIADDIYSGSLKGDSTIRRIESQLRSMFTDDSSTPGTTLKAFRDLGLDIDRTGVMSLNKTKLDSAANANFDDIVMIFSGKTDNQTELGTANRGIAGDAIKSINDLISTRGTIMTQSKGATARIGDYELKLNALNIRMEALLARYTKQFGIMETMVGQSNAMRDSLKTTFEGMMSMYTKK